MTTIITVDAVAEIVTALADDEDDRQQHIADVLNAVGDAFLGPIVDDTDEDYPDAAAEAAYLNVAEWARQAAADLERLLMAVEA